MPAFDENLPSPLRHPLYPLLLGIAAAGLFFLLRNLALPGGDTKVILSFSDTFLWEPHLVYYSREPLAHALSHGLYRLTGSFQMAFSLLSCLCGGFYVMILTGFSRRPLFLAVNLLGIGTMNFVGHIEYYAPLMVTLPLYLLLLVRALDPRSRVQPIHAVLAFVLSYFCHKLTLFFAPAMLWLIIERWEGHWRLRPWPGRQAEWILAALIAMAVLDLLPGFLYQYNLLPVKIVYVFTNEGLLDWLTPLTPAMARALEAHSKTGMFYLYTMGQPRHWMFFLGFLAMSAPAGLPLLAILGRRMRPSPATFALGTCVVIAIAWMFVWHPRVQWYDWDLFAMGAIPINLLAGALLVRLRPFTKA